jgi:DNA-binding MltR family transcriptional regulator
MSRVQAAIAELEGENERAVAVVGAAWLDELLAELLATAMRDDDVSRHLLDPLAQGPISSYAARIRMAYALELIGLENMKDLLQVGRIRNLFAHTVHRRSFDNETVRKECQKLKTGPRVASQHDRENPRGQYVSTVAFLSFVLANAIERRKKTTSHTNT